MKQTRLIFFLIILAAIMVVGAAALYSLFFNIEEPHMDTLSGQPAPTSLPANSLLIPIASSSTKQSWMDEVAAQFNDAGFTTSDGSQIVVEVSPVLSGGSKNDILAGKIEPIAWSPGSLSWTQQMDEAWRLENNRPIFSQPCQDTIYTPLGIAMWRPMAETLGWPDEQISWQTMVDLAANPDGWGSYDRPEWGKFRFGHAHPQYSNAGLLTMTSFVYGMTGKTDALTAAEIYNPEVEAALTTLGQNTSKYGRITTDLLNLMALEGPSYLHAVATFESDTINMNLNRSDELQFPLAFIFPAGGTFWGSHPYCILDNAPWVSAEEADAAQLFLDYVLAAEQQASASTYLLRPLDGNMPADSLLQLTNGTDPRVTTEIVPPLPDPDADLGAAVIDLFMQTKRKATVIIVLDTSGSMDGDKIRSATTATANFLSRLDKDDAVALLTFSNVVSTLSPPSRVGDVSEALASRVNSLIADGNTTLHDAVCEAAELGAALQAEDEAAGESRLYGIVVLSDGEDTGSHTSENQMFATCLPANAEADGVKIFPIAFGDDANESTLNRIARVTGGKMLIAQPTTIERVYQAISAEQ